MPTTATASRFCPTCNYNLTGLQTNQPGPECGWPKVKRRSHWPRTLVLPGFWIATAIVVSFFLIHTILSLWTHAWFDALTWALQLTVSILAAIGIVRWWRE